MKGFSSTHVARVAVNASDAVAPCSLLPAGFVRHASCSRPVGAVRRYAEGNPPVCPRLWRRAQRSEAAEPGSTQKGEPLSDSHVFQACSIDHSDISPFRINDLRSRVDQASADSDKSSNVPRSRAGISSIAAEEESVEALSAHRLRDMGSQLGVPSSN